MKMSWMRKSRAPLLAILTLAAVPALAAAQDGVPTRVGNIWDWRDHEPVPSVVNREERLAGIDPSPAQERKATDEVETLYRQLLGEAKGR